MKGGEKKAKAVQDAFNLWITGAKKTSMENYWEDSEANWQC